MKKLGVFGMFVTAMLVASVASADGDTGWYPIAQYVHSGTQAQILLDGRDSNCSSAVDTRYRIDQSTAYYEPVAKLLLSAFLAGREVNLTYTCSSGGNAYITTARVH
jgi:hypothetical protein